MRDKSIFTPTLIVQPSGNDHQFFLQIYDSPGQVNKVPARVMSALKIGYSSEFVMYSGNLTLKMSLLLTSGPTDYPPTQTTPKRKKPQSSTDDAA